MNGHAATRSNSNFLACACALQFEEHDILIKAMNITTFLSVGGLWPHTEHSFSIILY